MSLHPGPKHPTSQSDSTELAEVLRRGWLFGVTYHNMRGDIASATGAWAILLDRSAAIRKCPNSGDGHRVVRLIFWPHNTEKKWDGTEAVPPVQRTGYACS